MKNKSKYNTMTDRQNQVAGLWYNPKVPNQYMLVRPINENEVFCELFEDGRKKSDKTMSLDRVLTPIVNNILVRC